MSIAYAAAMGVLDDAPPALVQPNAVRSPAALTRAQVSSRATVLGASAWTEVLADTARFAGAAGALLFEGQRGNSTPNPRAEGSVAGSPGTPPTGWTMNLATTTNGLTRNIIGVQTIAGAQCLVVEVSGIATAGTSFDIGTAATNAITAAVGEVWSLGCLAAVISGSTSGVIFRNAAVEFTAGGTALATQLGATRGMSATPTRCVDAFTLGNAAVERVQHRWRLTISSGTDLTVPLRIAVGWPQAERAPFASSPVLPLAGSPAAVTRGADQMTAALAALGLPASGLGTILWSGTLTVAAPAGAAQTVLQLDDGGTSNGFVLLNEAGGSQIILRRLLAGVASDVVLGTMTPGMRFRLGIALNGAGRAAASLNGGAAQAVTGGPTAGLTTLRLGAGAAAERPFFGEMTALRYRRVTLSDAGLPGVVAALP